MRDLPVMHPLNSAGDRGKNANTFTQAQRLSCDYLFQRTAIHELSCVKRLAQDTVPGVVESWQRWIGLPRQYPRRVPLIVVPSKLPVRLRSGTRQWHLDCDQPARLDQVPRLVDEPRGPTAQLRQNLVAIHRGGLGHHITSATEA